MGAVLVLCAVVAAPPPPGDRRLTRTVREFGLSVVDDAVPRDGCLSISCILP